MAPDNFGHGHFWEQVRQGTIGTGSMFMIDLAVHPTRIAKRSARKMIPAVRYEKPGEFGSASAIVPFIIP